jgi:hypothetical protein
MVFWFWGGFLFVFCRFFGGFYAREINGLYINLGAAIAA